jgi:hypothetical protein
MYFVSEMAQVEVKSARVSAPATGSSPAQHSMYSDDWEVEEEHEAAGCCGAVESRRQQKEARQDAGYRYGGASFAMALPAGAYTRPLHSST